MGLAYNLDTTQNPYLTSGLSNYFVQFPNYLQWRINFTVQGDPTKTAAPNGNVYPGFNGNLLCFQPSSDANPNVVVLGNLLTMEATHPYHLTDLLFLRNCLIAFSHRKKLLWLMTMVGFFVGVEDPAQNINGNKRFSPQANT